MPDIRAMCAIGRRGQLGLNGRMAWEGAKGAEYTADVQSFFELTRGHSRVLAAGRAARWAWVGARGLALTVELRQAPTCRPRSAEAGRDEFAGAPWRRNDAASWHRPDAGRLVS